MKQKAITQKKRLAVRDNAGMIAQYECNNSPVHLLGGLVPSLGVGIDQEVVEIGHQAHGLAQSLTVLH